MLNRRQAIKTAAFAATSLVAGRAFGQSQTINLRLAHDSPTSTGWHIGATKMADLVRQRSNGVISIRVYPAAQLGDTREIAELVKAGTIDMALLTAGVAASFVPSLNLLGLPFLVTDVEQGRAFYKSAAAQELMKDVDAGGFKGLGFNNLTFRSPMNTRGPINVPSDMQGLKIRLQQVPIHLDTYRAFGASPIALPYSEVYSAAQSRVIDGVENSPAGVFGPKFHEVMRYYSLVPVFLNACLLVMSQKAWNALSPANQQLVAQAASEGNDMISQEYVTVDKTSLERMEAFGTNVNKGPFDLRPWRQAVQPVYDKYMKELPETGRRIVAQLKNW